MTAKELLTPRFEVIADFPNSNLEINSILTFDGIVYGMNEPQKFIRNPEKYLHLFKKLEWWEKRKIEDMPKKIMALLDRSKYVYEIVEWDMKSATGWANKEKRRYCNLIIHDYIPVD